MVKVIKRLRGLAEKLPGETPVPVEQAVTLLKQFNNVKFDQSVDIAMRLGVDPNQADQIVRGSIVLPHGIGKTLRVIVFAKGDLAAQAEEAQARHQRDTGQGIELALSTAPAFVVSGKIVPVTGEECACSAAARLREVLKLAGSRIWQEERPVLGADGVIGRDYAAFSKTRQMRLQTAQNPLAATKIKHEPPKGSRPKNLSTAATELFTHAWLISLWGSRQWARKELDPLLVPLIST